MFQFPLNSNLKISGWYCTMIVWSDHVSIQNYKNDDSNSHRKDTIEEATIAFENYEYSKSIQRLRNIPLLWILFIFQFEDDAFDTVPDLITFYVGSGKPITCLSGARIQFPKNRMYPLSFYASKYPTPLPQSRLTSPATTPIGCSHYRHPPLPGRNSGSPTRITRDTVPRLPSKKQRSHSLTPNEVNRMAHEKCNSADGVIQSTLMTRSAGPETASSNLKFSTHSLPRSTHAKLSLSVSSNTLGRNCRVTSDPTLSPCAERKMFDENDSLLSESPPPKPSRIPGMHRTESRDSDVTDYQHTCGFLTHGGVQRVTSYHASGSDSGNGSGDSALSSAAGQ